MIVDGFQTGTHADQRRTGVINALKEAGIGRRYADRTLDEFGEQGSQLKTWLLANLERVSEGYGFDFRGDGVLATHLVNMAGRSLLRIGHVTKIIPLVRLPKVMADDEGLDTLRRTHCLIINDFQTAHECPLRPYELAEVEALIQDRAGDCQSTSVVRRKHTQAPWWSQTAQDILEANCRVVEIV